MFSKLLTCDELMQCCTVEAKQTAHSIWIAPLCCRVVRSTLSLEVAYDELGSIFLVFEDSQTLYP